MDITVYPNKLNVLVFREYRIPVIGLKTGIHLRFNSAQTVYTRTAQTYEDGSSIFCLFDLLALGYNAAGTE